MFIPIVFQICIPNTTMGTILEDLIRIWEIYKAFIQSKYLHEVKRLWLSPHMHKNKFFESGSPSINHGTRLVEAVCSEISGILQGYKLWSPSSTEFPSYLEFWKVVASALHFSRPFPDLSEKNHFSRPFHGREQKKKFPTFFPTVGTLYTLPPLI